MPFINNKEKFPVRFSSEYHSERQERIISQEYYRQQAIVEFFDLIKKNDPESIVVIVGDHAPIVNIKREKELDRPFLKPEKTYTVPLIIYDRGEFVSLEGKGDIELLEVYQMVFDGISNGRFCEEEYECYDKTERYGPVSFELYHSFASNILKR